MIKADPFSKESNSVTQNTHLSQIRLTLVLLIASLLSGCGFHLRGDYLVPEEVGKMSVTSFDDYAQFTRNVKTQLRRNGIEIVPPAADISNLHLISESIGERTLSIYQNSRAAEKELTLRARYRVVVPDIGLKTFSTQVNRSFLDNPLTALAKSVERDMIEGEMREQAARQIIRQLARLRADIRNNTAELDPDTNEQGMMDEPSQLKDTPISLSSEDEKPDLMNEIQTSDGTETGTDTSTVTQE